MDVLHKFTNEKKTKNKLSKDISFNHMYKHSDQLGGKIHSSLPKMTMPKMTMPKIAYSVPKYSSHPSKSPQNFNFNNLIHRDRSSRNETASSLGPAHITGENMSSIISTAKGPADPNITASAKQTSKGIYGTTFKDLQVTALTDSQAKALLPTVGAQLSAGMTPDVVTLKQLEPYLKVGATQTKPVDITASGLTSNRLTKGTGFTGPGDPTYTNTTYGPVHDLGLSQPMYNYFQPGLTMKEGTPGILATRQAGNTANITAVTNQAIVKPIDVQSNVATAIGGTTTYTSSGGGGGSSSSRSSSSSGSKTTTPAPAKSTTPAPAPAAKAITVPSSGSFLPNPSGNAASNIGAIDKAASSGKSGSSGGGVPTFAPVPKAPTLVQKVVSFAKNIFGKK